MSIYVVPQTAWGNILDSFSRLHRGWPACVRGVDSDHPLSWARRWRPLAAVRLAPPSNAPAIRIEFTDGATVNVQSPRELRLEAGEDGAERALEIDRRAGEHVRLVFRARARPEELREIASAEVVHVQR
jgi:hypothetical protein